MIVDKARKFDSSDNLGWRMKWSNFYLHIFIRVVINYVEKFRKQSGNRRLRKVHNIVSKPILCFGKEKRRMIKTVKTKTKSADMRFLTSLCVIQEADYKEKERERK